MALFCQDMNRYGVTIAYLSRLTGVSSETIASYVKQLRPLASQMDEEGTFTCAQ
jgi:hypothetical protein